MKLKKNFHIKKHKQSILPLPRLYFPNQNVALNHLRKTKTGYVFYVLIVLNLKYLPILVLPQIVYFQVRE
jgi:hypothetical protein